MTRRRDPHLVERRDVFSWVLIALFVLAAIILLWPACVRAECKDNWCHGPSAATAAFALNLRTGEMTGGPAAVPLGVCYGITYRPAWGLGADGCLNVVLATESRNSFMPSLTLHLEDYVSVGLGALGRKRANGDGLYWQAVLLVGGRLPIAQF